MAHPAASKPPPLTNKAPLQIPFNNKTGKGTPTDAQWHGSIGHDTFLIIALELLGVGLLTLLAGVSDDVGRGVVIFVVGLWLIYLFAEATTVARVGNLFSSIANANAK
jgi:hypothetical protein